MADDDKTRAVEPDPPIVEPEPDAVEPDPDVSEPDPPVERDRKGRCLPGTTMGIRTRFNSSSNKSPGRPPTKPFRRMLLKILREKDARGRTRLENLARTAIVNAAAGKPAYFTRIADTLDGPIPKHVVADVGLGAVDDLDEDTVNRILDGDIPVELLADPTDDPLDAGDGAADDAETDDIETDDDLAALLESEAVDALDERREFENETDDFGENRV